MDGYQPRYETQSDGSFRIVAVPGRGLVWVSFAPDRYRFGIGVESIELFKQNEFIWQVYQPAPSPDLLRAVSQVDIPERGMTDPLDLKLDPGQDVHVFVVDPDGTV